MQQLERRVRSLEFFRDKVEERGFIYLGKPDDHKTKQVNKLHDILRRTEFVAKRTTSNPGPQMEDPPPKAIVATRSQDQLKSVPIQAIVATTASLVWPCLRDWIFQKDQEGSRKAKFGNFLRLIDSRNVRQALFERDKKAQSKYGTGLSFESEVSSFPKSVEKLSDTVYFLFKTLKDAQELSKTNINEYKRQLDLVSDLHSILGAFIADLRTVSK